MRFKKIKIRPLLSDTIQVRDISSWHDMTDAETWSILTMMISNKIDMSEIPLRAFMLVNGFMMIGKSGDGRWLIAGEKDILEITAPLAAKLSKPYNFLRKVPSRPWRPGNFGSRNSISVNLQELTLADWLAVENYLQRVIAADDYTLLDNLAPILLRRHTLSHLLNFGRSPKLTDPQRLALFFWIASVRTYLRRRFPDYYSDIGGKDPITITPQQLQEATDAQIRALTKGDITKEKEVLSQPMYRALSELNALAREYKELKSDK